MSAPPAPPHPTPTATTTCFHPCAFAGPRFLSVALNIYGIFVCDLNSPCTLSPSLTSSLPLSPPLSLSLPFSPSLFPVLHLSHRRLHHPDWIRMRGISHYNLAMCYETGYAVGLSQANATVVFNSSCIYVCVCVCVCVYVCVSVAVLSKCCKHFHPRAHAQALVRARVQAQNTSTHAYTCTRPCNFMLTPHFMHARTRTHAHDHTKTANAGVRALPCSGRARSPGSHVLCRDVPHEWIRCGGCVCVSGFRP